MPQFENIRNKVINYKNISIGLFIFSIGLFKKVVIADKFAIWATTGFNATETLTFLDAWVTSLSYSFQLYFDFSGYTDMAIGAAFLFNITLPINFNSPYKAKNIQDFWSRWHITLSTFLKDYIYIPMGGNRKGSFRTYHNLLMTFILGGLWHGAGWTFIFWGVLHGVFLIIHRIWNKLGFKLWTWLAWFITFNFINIAWVFFRAKDWNDAIKILGSMFSSDGFILSAHLEKNFSFLREYGIEFGRYYEGINGDDPTALWILAGFIIVLFLKNSIEYIDNFKPNYKTALVSGIAFVGGVLSLNKVSEFLYFNF
jgi:D-alanyl-lipoteichoic acid acyltransferase DltB (MBOAT superfamily)